MIENDAFLRAFESLALPPGDFRHADHVRLAWIYLRQAPFDEALARLSSSILRFASRHGAPEKYHETITHAWMILVQHALTRLPEATFPEFLNAHPHLLDARILQRYYSPAVLQSGESRRRFIPPDLHPLPSMQSPSVSPSAKLRPDHSP
ncbi:MAG: hypothetical protein IT167_20255 [Bryobacterales bacterium]|nr:hypothetical protein [Bryobacterales bacterium]